MSKWSSHQHLFLWSWLGRGFGASFRISSKDSSKDSSFQRFGLWRWGKDENLRTELYFMNLNNLQVFYLVPKQSTSVSTTKVNLFWRMSFPEKERDLLSGGNMHQNMEIKPIIKLLKVSQQHFRFLIVVYIVLFDRLFETKILQFVTTSSVMH